MPKLPPPPPVCAHSSRPVCGSSFRARTSRARPRRLNADHVHPGQVVHGQAVQPGQQPVPAAHDVAACPHRVTGAAGQAEVKVLEQGLVDVPEGGAAVNAHPAGRVQAHALHPAQVDDDAAVVPGREVLVAVPAAAHGDAQPRVVRPLDGRHGLARAADHLDVRGGTDPPPVEAHAHGGIPGVGGVDRPQSAPGRPGGQPVPGSPGGTRRVVTAQHGPGEGERARTGQQAPADGEESPSSEGTGLATGSGSPAGRLHRRRSSAVNSTRLWIQRAGPAPELRSGFTIRRLWPAASLQAITK